MNRFAVIIILVVAVSQVNCWSFWPFSSDKASSSNPNEGAHLSKSLVPFEMTDVEEAFLAEAQKYMGKMRPLDSCHQVVINRIKKSCSDINEEELAKLGVQLLNCQSLAENRKTYECTDDMSIAQCTSNMDSETWNSYHIISNRARSVCYATRQQQFRLKTEYTVNQLGKQAGEQLHLMDSLKTGQSKLVDLATDTVDKMTAGQKVLVSQQRRIHLTQVANQRTIENHVNKNIKTLSRENSLIDKNHAQLTSMAHTINNKLETATNLLKNQENNLKQSHSEVLHDLNDIRVKAQDVWYKLDDSANHMLKNQNESANHYKDTIENLKRINKTISYLLDAIETTQSKLDDKITWLARQFGATGYQISTMVTVMLHAGYFLVATYGIVFVQAPVVTRVAVVIVVPGNALCEINFGTSLTFSHLTAVLISVLIVNWTYIQFRRRRVSHPSTPKKELDTSWSPLAIRNLSNTNYKSPCTGTPCSHTPLSSTFNSTIISKQPSLSPTDTDAKRKLDLSSIFESSTSTPLKTSKENASTPLKNNNKSTTPLKNTNNSVSTPLKNNNQSVSTPLKNNKASTPGRGLNTPKRCTAVTKTGKACKKKTSNDSTVCSIHDISRS